MYARIALQIAPLVRTKLAHALSASLVTNSSLHLNVFAHLAATTLVANASHALTVSTGPVLHAVLAAPTVPYVLTRLVSVIHVKTLLSFQLTQPQNASVSMASIIMMACVLRILIVAVVSPGTRLRTSVNLALIIVQSVRTTLSFVKNVMILPTG